MSWKVEVQVVRNGEWHDNALRFATKTEAEANIRELVMRWLAVNATRIVESDDPANYRYADRTLAAIQEPRCEDEARTFSARRDQR